MWYDTGRDMISYEKLLQMALTGKDQGHRWVFSYQVIWVLGQEALQFGQHSFTKEHQREIDLEAGILEPAEVF